MCNECGNNAWTLTYRCGSDKWTARGKAIKSNSSRGSDYRSEERPPGATVIDSIGKQWRDYEYDRLNVLYWINCVTSGGWLTALSVCFVMRMDSFSRGKGFGFEKWVDMKKEKWVDMKKGHGFLARLKVEFWFALQFFVLFSNSWKADPKQNESIKLTSL
jgi:hypothetical protein